MGNSDHGTTYLMETQTQWPVWKLRLDLEPLEGRTPIDFKFCKVCHPATLWGGPDRTL